MCDGMTSVWWRSGIERLDVSRLSVGSCAIVCFDGGKGSDLSTPIFASRKSDLYNV